MEDRALAQAFLDALFADLVQTEQFPAQRPLLAHYTSLETLENVVRSDEVWFSNPLFMNDYEEVKFGILNGVVRLKENLTLRAALKADPRRVAFYVGLDRFAATFERDHLLDTYVLSFSLHESNDRDGRLSMWRGYGGNGRGVAVVFDTTQINVLPSSPLVIAKVHYGTGADRLSHIDLYANAIADTLTKVSVPEDKLHVVAWASFERLKLFAFFTKHIGYAEEQEWRAVYLRDRDTDNKLTSMFGYSNGPRGVEPKLKFKVKPISGFSGSDLSLEKIIHSIILGPTASSPLALLSVGRMLELLGKPDLKGRLYASSIPFRTS